MCKPGEGRELQTMNVARRKPECGAKKPKEGKAES